MLQFTGQEMGHLQQNNQSLQQDQQQLQQKIQQLQKTIQQLQETIQRQEKKINRLSAALTDKENIISDQNYKVTAIQQQVDSLNGRLSEIYASEGWKLLSIYYRFKERVLPEGSNRYTKLKKLVNKLRNKKSHAPFIDFTPGKQYITEEITSFDVIEFPQFEQPKVSIIIPAYNGWQMNYRCLRSIYQHTHGVPYEVIFADDGSSDESANIKEYIRNITVVRNKTNLGFLRNCNNAASFAKGDYIHFLNNDTEVTPDWLSSLSALMDKDPSIGMSGSKLVYPDGRLQEAGGIIWHNASAWNYGHKQNPDAPEFNYLKEVDYVSGASMMVRKSAWNQLGGFDELYSPAYCEDTDLAFEIRRLGFKVVYQPLSVVVHHEGFSHGTDHKPQSGLTQTKSYQRINLNKFLHKWKEEIKTHFPSGVNLFWARDKSLSKKTILVIDHYVPEFDKDAGSRTTFQYLEALTELDFNVKFLTDNFYRSEPYTTILQQKGIEVLYGLYYANNWQQWLIENQKYIQFVLLNRPHISTKYIDFLKKNTRARVYYYGHDLHYYRELQEYALTKDEKKIKSSSEWKKIEYDLFKKADVVLTPTTKEKVLIQEDFANKWIEVMPAFFYSTISPAISNFDKRKHLLFVGGFNHGPNVDAVLWFVEQVLPVVLESIPELQLIVVGSKTPEKIQQLASASVIIKGFVSDEELDQLYQSVKMVVVPLRYGAGLKGKTVEAMSKGLPMVSTSFGLEGLDGLMDVVRPNDNATDFANAILTLYNDNKALEKQSIGLVNYANAHFTKESAKQFFSSIFK